MTLNVKLCQLKPNEVNTAVFEVLPPNNEVVCQNLKRLKKTFEKKWRLFSRFILL